MAAPAVETPYQPMQNQSNASGEKRRDSSAVTNDIPSVSTLETCDEVPVYDADGQSRPFKDLCDSKGSRKMVIFVRHFFCGVRY